MYGLAPASAPALPPPQFVPSQSSAPAPPAPSAAGCPAPPPRPGTALVVAFGPSVLAAVPSNPAPPPGPPSPPLSPTSGSAPPAPPPPAATRSRVSVALPQRKLEQVRTSLSPPPPAPPG